MVRASIRETGQRLRTAADAAATYLPPLLVAARRIAATVAMGSHGRRRAGPGEAFWQFRPYSRDDTPQSIDWRQTGKFDVVYVREREWVAAQTVAVWCDLSPSMHYRSGRNLPTKAERAAILALALAELLTEGGERLMHLAADGHPTRPASGRVAVAQMADSLSATLARAATATDAAMPAFTTPLPRHSTVILVSDFLSSLQDIATSVRNLARHGDVGHLVQVIDPAEETLPFRGRIRFVGLEQEGDAIVERAENVRAAYLERLIAHRDGLKQIAAQAGWSFAVHHTDRPPQVTLAALHQVLTSSRR